MQFNHQLFGQVTNARLSWLAATRSMSFNSEQHLIFRQRLSAPAETTALHLLDDLTQSLVAMPVRRSASPSAWRHRREANSASGDYLRGKPASGSGRLAVSINARRDDRYW
jgi:hypothetical protein